ncbi:IucA/IucC family protein [Domibacillus iocasae]|uniref:Siderophore biosynthesis protein n=1 Tax=Domibacillus iocasae TaxID=1714016 RepID=A0A1E7DNZ3_9BACI|nr:IucA/IucC family protein [Domibacillus iocasae]OES44769.1 hypothetical protein BA724_05700 [Domibacillus iocasae]
MIVNNQRLSWEQAQFHTCKTLLNCYIREYGHKEKLFSRDQNQNNYSVFFPTSNVEISGSLSFYSAIGEHEYENFFVKGSRNVHYSDIVQWIVAELRTNNMDITDERAGDFLKKVQNSYEKLSIFLAHSSQPPEWNYQSSEQSLVYGHPFHPFPKNTLGFSEREVKQFCPELRTSFQLCYLAVRHDMFEEEWAVGEEKIKWPETVKEQARQLLNEKEEEYAILPVHPWQYENVLLVEDVQKYIKEGKLILLGRFGPDAYPTSSVRTVYVPEMNCNIKLSLNIQITNMMRNNNREQMRRTMDASNYLLRQKSFQNESHTSISYETGVCGCRFENDETTKLFTIVYRPIHFDTTSTYVLSSLIETPAGEERSRLYSLIGSHSVEEWFKRYLAISMIPMLCLAEKAGIHFEAHLQNTLLTIKEGMPYEFIIRDLEGVSVNKEKAASNVDTDGPLFYTKEDAWARTSYYFVVNHLGSMIHAIAKDAKKDEEYFWGIVNDVLVQEEKKSPNEYIRHLLTTPAFMAKKNMISCLVGKSETPFYVPVSNLVKKARSGIYASTV